jgi:predicted ATP-dependent endonuclease of OLD family
VNIKSYRVFNFKNIDDSNEIEVDEKVTCLVGKNEAGKTATIQALYRINPVEEKPFDEVKEYPRKNLRSYQRKVKSGQEQPAKAITAIFKFSKKEEEEFISLYGDILNNYDQLSITITYENKKLISIPVNEEKWVKIYIKNELPESATNFKAKSIKDLLTTLNELEDKTPFNECIANLNQINSSGLIMYLYNEFIKERIPKVFFFDDYSIMKGNAPLNQITGTTADPGIKTLNELLILADVTPQELQNNSNYEHHKANLEAIANEITDDVFKYWKQNAQLEVEFDVHRPAGNNHPGEFHIRIKNNKHRVTVPFDERSRGFVWFFSFLTAFKKLSEDHKQLIILLDEPGLNLHASAQADLLRFIEDVLSENHQIIYTTHSPFMIDSQHIERVRTVEDIDNAGVKVSSECLTVDKNTVFPMQAALGYSLAQTLFLGPNCLLVEGPSDLLFIQTISNILAEKGMEPLSENWVITPVGGADKLATFATLIGANELNICVLMDIAKKDKQRVDNLKKNSFLTQRSIIELNQFTKNSEADIEDLFEVDEYIDLVKKAYSPLKDELMASKLDRQPRIIKRIEAFIKKNNISVSYNHYKPSYIGLTCLGSEIVLSDDTLKRFESMFITVNKLLP